MTGKRSVSAGRRGVLAAAAAAFATIGRSRAEDAPAMRSERIDIGEGLLGTRVTPAPSGAAVPTPVLLVHGMNGGAWHFHELQGVLAARGRPSLALDLRGHNGSRPVAKFGAVSVEDYVEDATVAARSLGRCAVIGQSMGGLIAQKLAERGWVTAAGFVCSVPPAGIRWDAATPHMDDMRRLSSKLEGRDLTPQAGFEVYEDLVFNHIPPAVRAALHARLVDESGLASAQLFRGDIAVDERRVRCPTLTVIAGDDRLVRPDVGRAIAAKYRSTEIIMPDSGHYLIVAEAKRMLAAGLIADWLDDALGDGAS